jgi:hypothetical protein
VIRALALLVVACGPVSLPPPPPIPREPGFARALGSFRAFAAKTIGGAPYVGPQVETIRLPESIGGAWAFEASRGVSDLRGWALADGTVITTSTNLGLLVEQAGSIGPDFVKAITWTFGASYQADDAPPDVRLGPDGAGTISFHLTMRIPGSDGAGGGPYFPYLCTITVGADHHTELKLVKQ